MITPLRDQILVKLLPRHETKVDIILVDKKKHYEGLRRGVVQYVGPLVGDVVPGDTVYFPGDYGESFDMDGHGINDGTGWRRIREKHCLCVEPAAALQEAAV